jgi:hypothetical protein
MPIIRKSDCRTFIITEDDILLSGSIYRYFTQEQLRQMQVAIRNTILLYRKLKLNDKEIEFINDELVKKEMNGTSL